MKNIKTETSENRYIVPAFARGLNLIELLAGHPEGMQMTEMEQLELPPATLYRMLMTLCETGYAVRKKNGLYQLNGKLLAVAYRAVENKSLLSCAEAPMRELRDRTGESVMLGVLHGEEGVVIHQEVSKHPVKVILEVGHHFPLHSAAPAKAILAFLEPHRADGVIRSIRYTPFTPKTIRNGKAYRAELEKVRKCGVAYDCGEEMEDLNCVAAPVREKRNRSVSAVWITGPASRLTRTKMKQFAGLVEETARRIEETLNGTEL